MCARGATGEQSRLWNLRAAVENDEDQVVPASPAPVGNKPSRCGVTGEKEAPSWRTGDNIGRVERLARIGQTRVGSEPRLGGGKYRRLYCRDTAERSPC